MEAGLLLVARPRCEDEIDLPVVAIQHAVEIEEVRLPEGAERETDPFAGRSVGQEAPIAARALERIPQLQHAPPRPRDRDGAGERIALGVAGGGAYLERLA